MFFHSLGNKSLTFSFSRQFLANFKQFFFFFHLDYLGSGSLMHFNNSQTLFINYKQVTHFRGLILSKVRGTNICLKCVSGWGDTIVLYARKELQQEPAQNVG